MIAKAGASPLWKLSSALKIKIIYVIFYIKTFESFTQALEFSSEVHAYASLSQHFLFWILSIYLKVAWGQAGLLGISKFLSRNIWKLYQLILNGRENMYILLTFKRKKRKCCKYFEHSHTTQLKVFQKLYYINIKPDSDNNHSSCIMLLE